MKLSHLLLALLLVSIAFILLVKGHDDDDDHNRPDSNRNFHKVLKNYIKKPTPNYSYTLLTQFNTTVATVYILNMTSVTWLPDEFQHRSQWYHYLEIAVPFNLDRSINEGLLYITSGYNTPVVPSTVDNLSLGLANYSRTVTTTIHMVPNQPLTFASDPEQLSRVEDGIIAYAWKHFIQNPTISETKWIPRLPMVKSSLLALDTAQDFVKKTINLKLKKFTIVGASKRGWTTWVAGMTQDKRIKSIIPMVIQILNCKKVFTHIYNSLCAFPISMYDYSKENITGKIDTEGFDKLTQVIDPIYYKEDLAKYRKYLVNSLGDEFFWPDLSIFSYNELPNRKNKHMRYIPNSGHSMSGSDVLLTTASYYYAVLHNIELPEYSFSHEYTPQGVHIKVFIWNGKIPTAVTSWSANNPTTRDFRQTTIGRVWGSANIAPKKPNNPFYYEVFFPNPAQGYSAITIELKFEGYFADKTVPYLKFTTDAYVVPNHLPCDYKKDFGVSHQ